ncbi:MAG: hypothetical protein ABH814_02355, partial [bacterium]
MKIHLSGSNTTAIEKTLHAGGHTLTHKKDSKNPVDNVMASILACDAAILEITKSSFTQGFETALCLDKKKPILLLIGREAPENFAKHIDSELITYKQFTKGNLSKIIDEFLQQAGRGGEKTRFNFFIDRRLENYLDWAAHTYRTNKA